MLSKDEIRERLDDDFDTNNILDSVENLDSVRQVLADDETTFAPCELRQQLLELHTKLFHFVNHGSGDVSEIFEEADDIEVKISDLAESLEQIQEMLSKVTDITSQGLEDY